MILVLATKMNFTPNWTADYDAITLGRLQKDNTWSGMISKVKDGLVDIAANGYWRTQDRMSAVHFTFPFDKEEMAMMIQKTSEDHKYLFLTPFTWDVSYFLLYSYSLFNYVKVNALKTRVLLVVAQSTIISNHNL